MPFEIFLGKSAKAAVFEDEGCAFHPTCLTCPFPECIYGEGSGFIARYEEYVEAVKLVFREPEITASELARRTGTSERSAHRLLAKFKSR